MDTFMKLNRVQQGIVLLTVVTAVIHIGLAIPSELIFYLNGFGYLALVAALYFLPQFANMRSLVRWALTIYTVVTIVLFFVFNASTGYGPLGLITKAIEAVLLILLLLDGR